ncbi:hypothetical protein CAPN009_15340 [Capnocytophaga canimorsus]|nr:hypothetical protein CAPN009_15340 [Capnocytophaga canimorsus]
MKPQEYSFSMSLCDFKLNLQKLYVFLILVRLAYNNFEVRLNKLHSPKNYKQNSSKFSQIYLPQYSLFVE